MYGSAAEWQAKNGGGSWSALIYSTIGRVAIGRVTIGRVTPGHAEYPPGTQSTVGMRRQMM